MPRGGNLVYDIRLRGSASLRGQIQAPHGPGHYRVTLSQRNGTEIGAGLSYTGSFEFAHLAPGEYVLHAKCNNAPGKDVPLTLENGKTTDFGTIRLESYPVVLVHVTAPEDTTLPTHMYVGATAKGAPPRVGTIIVSGTGYGTLTGLPAGDYTLTLLQPGFEKTTLNVKVEPDRKAAVEILLTPTD